MEITNNILRAIIEETERKECFLTEQQLDIIEYEINFKLECALNR